jgi:hypothetical protein
MTSSRRITYLNERSPTATAKLDADIARWVERLADRQFDGACLTAPLWCRRAELGVPPLRILRGPHVSRGAEYHHASSFDNSSKWVSSCATSRP